MNLRPLFERRIKGFRAMELVSIACLVVLVLGVYLAKTAGGREGAELARVNAEIGEEKTKVRLLQAELAHLERPDRIERLASDYLGMGPVPAKRETLPEGLSEIAHRTEGGR